MRQLTFGRSTGLRVSEFALGTGNFGTRWGAGATRDEAAKIFDRFAGAGGNLIDTADQYQSGQAETMLAEFLASGRDQFVVGSKFSLGTGGFPAGPGGPRAPQLGNSRKSIRTSVEASLKRLNTDYIDLYWAHLPDEVTPVEEILAALDDLIRAGKILYAGLSNFPAWRVCRAATLAEVRGWPRLAGVQFEYSVAERSADRELLPMAAALGLGVATWSPLGGGLLTGKYRHGRQGRLSDWGGRAIRTEDSEQRTRVLDTVLAVADEADISAAQVSMAWLRARAARLATAVIPVIGPRSPGQLEEYLAALDVSLDEAQLRRLDQVSAVPLGQPHETAARSLDLVGGRESATVARPFAPVA